MAIQRVGHVVVKSRDLEQAKRFYRDTLGMTISSETDVAIFFRFGEYHHDIGVFKVAPDAEIPRQDQTGLMHFALVLDSRQALVDMYHDLQAKGVKIEAAFDHGMTNSIYIFDPDQNAIEIYCEVPEYDWKTNDDFVAYLQPLDVEALATS